MVYEGTGSFRDLEKIVNCYAGEGWIYQEHVTSETQVLEKGVFFDLLREKWTLMARSVPENQPALQLHRADIQSVPELIDRVGLGYGFSQPESGA